MGYRFKSQCSFSLHTIPVEHTHRDTSSSADHPKIIFLKKKLPLLWMAARLSERESKKPCNLFFGRGTTLLQAMNILWSPMATRLRREMSTKPTANVKQQVAQLMRLTRTLSPVLTIPSRAPKRRGSLTPDRPAPGWPSAVVGLLAFF